MDELQGGVGVVVSMLSANWDPAAFEDPGELDVERGAGHHVALGFGPLPTLRLAVPAGVTW